MPTDYPAAATDDLGSIVASPAQSVDVPGFPVRCPPLLRDGQLVPQDPAAFGSEWQLGFVDARRIDVFHLRHVFVVGTKLVFDDQCRLIENIGQKPDPATVRTARATVIAASETGNIPLYNEYTVLAGCPASMDHDWFMLATLPGIAISKSIVAHGSPGALIPRAQPLLGDTMLRASRLAGIDPVRVISNHDSSAGYFEDLLVITGLASDTYLSPVAVHALDSLAAGIQPAAGRKILLTGEDARLRPDDRTISRLIARGFVAIDPLNLPLEEQIALFKGAELIVSFGGPGFANLVFCPPGTPVILVSPARDAGTLAWLVAAHRRLNYLEIQTDVSPSGAASPRESDLAFLEGVTKQRVADLVQNHD